MNTKNIYRNNNQILKETLSMYKPENILYVPIEIGKFNHKAGIVNFFGDVVINPFEFPCNKHGLDFFLKKLQLAMKISSAKKIFIGCESTGHYHLNLVYHLKQFSLPVESINPRDTSRENPNKNAKSDIIDLNAIARCLISNKGARQVIPEGIYYNLQRATRTRRKFVQRETSSKNTITRFAYAQQIISYAGSSSRKFSSAEYQAENLPITHFGSVFLRTTLNQIALSLNAWSQPFHLYYTKKTLEKKDRPGIARIATGNKFVKLAFALMKEEQLYRPKGVLLDEKSYYLGLWKKILTKLDGLDLSQVPPETNYLLKIKKQLQEQYGLKIEQPKLSKNGNFIPYLSGKRSFLLPYRSNVVS